MTSFANVGLRCLILASKVPCRIWHNNAILDRFFIAIMRTRLVSSNDCLADRGARLTRSCGPRQVISEEYRVQWSNERKTISALPDGKDKTVKMDAINAKIEQALSR